ncbi:hypothetical protein Micbo1qcDRAFT_226525 [Microdochium bolleyi]|uniref:Stealth protein CR3 conserved region 3 domain-containing protein n=1 Tax=Microdochium bolleyi TaxID=196109 RepID=A0A136J078_9PEZI|nr:hypothetical protein Micbo1qcDRAFT_226525 [Microdochium bolleyi]
MHRNRLSISAADSQDHRTSHGTVQSLEKNLPQVLRISLSDAVADVELEGWEDEWFAFGHYDTEKHGQIPEPKIDFVYNWVNGSDDAFNQLRHKYEVESPLNDAEGKWIAEHGVNRYRDWNELRYSLRSLATNASGFLNKIQILVNSYRNDGHSMHGQRPTWMKNDTDTDGRLQILPQEDFFGESAQQCLPTFNSLSIESQLHLTPSDTDRLVALSDDMLLGTPHAASDFYSPLFGSVMGFKPDRYNVLSLGSQDKWPTFGEKPFLYYTSYLLNHRFGARPRRVQAHFTHSVSRAVMTEAMAAFPGPAQRGACERFRGESQHFQLYPWYTAFHYSIERFREALLWSFIAARSDIDADGYLGWAERRQILEAIEPGRSRLDPDRERMYYRLPEELEAAGLERPKANVNVLWTSLDGPETIRGIKCHDFTVDKCLGDAFGSPLSDKNGAGGGGHNPDFTVDAVLSRLSTQHPRCGDCLIKFVLKKHRGLEPLLPPRSPRGSNNKRSRRDRQIVIRALKKYQHTVVDTDAMKFVMVKDAEQAERELLERNVRMGRRFGQWCLNDDVMTDDAGEVGKVKEVMGRVFEELWPGRSPWERDDI